MDFFLVITRESHKERETERKREREVEEDLIFVGLKSKNIKRKSKKRGREAPDAVSFRRRRRWLCLLALRYIEWSQISSVSSFPYFDYCEFDYRICFRVLIRLDLIWCMWCSYRILGLHRSISLVFIISLIEFVIL